MTNDGVILGLARTHDTGVVLMRGGEVLVVAESERVLDRKHARGPETVAPALAAALAEVGLSADAIEMVVVGDTGREGLERTEPDLTAHTHGPMLIAPLGTVGIPSIPLFSPLELEGVRQDTPLHGVCHHAAHAAGAVYQSGFEDCAVLVIDGYGVCCGTIAYSYRDGCLQRLDSWRDRALLGWRYQLFGFLAREIPETTDNLDLAGKVMGLHAFGRPRTDLVAYFENFFGEGYEHYAACWDPGRTYFSDLPGGGFRFKSASVEDPAFLDVIASMQEAFTRAVERMVAGLLAETGADRVVLSGGCALNVLTNSRVAAMPGVREAFFQPNAGDSGIPLGAAVIGSALHTGVPIRHPAISQRQRRSPYLGLGLLDRDAPLDLQTGVESQPAPATQPDTARTLARLLAENRIVGMVTGRSEIGPRALGHRSILANPACAGMRDILNRKVKHREWWRPYAPVCRSIDVERYFIAPHPSAYMMTAALVRPEWRAHLHAAAHDDGTARLQVLPARDDHPLLWDVLEEVERLTGVAVLINTSFNLGGMPLLNRASMAVRMLRETDMDAVWLDGRLLRKPEAGAA